MLISRTCFLVYEQLNSAFGGNLLSSGKRLSSLTSKGKSFGSLIPKLTSVHPNSPEERLRLWKTLNLSTVIRDPCSNENGWTTQEIWANQSNIPSKESVLCGLCWPEARIR
ncbi:hypothetical protein ACROYT_G011213 [Oculina patagonica]